MEAVGHRRHVRAFKATDALVIEAYRLAGSLAATSDPALIRRIRRTAIDTGAALVAASAVGAETREELRLLEQARREVAAGRYYLYLARRLGFVGVRSYRTLSARHDTVLRELDALVGRDGGERATRPPPAAA